jgi:very-short-patch-repair endonuclease
MRAAKGCLWGTNSGRAALEVDVTEEILAAIARRQDLLWRAERTIVEMDSWEFHSSRASFERDRARDQELIALGYAVIRVTWRQIVREPERIAARLAVTLFRHMLTGRE